MVKTSHKALTAPMPRSSSSSKSEPSRKEPNAAAPATGAPARAARLMEESSIAVDTSVRFRSIRTNHFGLVAHLQSTELPRGHHPAAAGRYRIRHFHEKPYPAICVIILGPACEGNILLANRQRPGCDSFAAGILPRLSLLTLAPKEFDALLRRGDIGGQ